MSSTKGKHKQQLHVEIDQTLSRVDELRASFQQNWDKLENGTPANREKTENLLRADLDKLKRQRKQIQIYMDMPEVATMRNKLKRYTDAIEADMSRHYIYERESKTKQFSNVALNDEHDKRTGPRASTKAWLDLCLTELNNRLEDLRSQLDGAQLQASTKKNAKMTKVNAADKLIVKLEGHKEQLVDIISAYEEGYITYIDIEVHLKKPLDEVIRACRNNTDVDVTTVIYDDIVELINTNKIYGSMESFEGPVTEQLDRTPSSSKSPVSGLGNKVVKETRNNNDKEAGSMSPTSYQDELAEITFSKTPGTNSPEGGPEAHDSVKDSFSKDKKYSNISSARQTPVSKQSSKVAKQVKSSADIINSESIDGSKGIHMQQSSLPPIKGGDPVQSTRVVRPIFQAASKLSALRPSPLEDNTLLYIPAETPAAISLYSLRLPKSLTLCTKPHAFKDVVPDLSRSIASLSQQIGSDQQAMNDVATHNTVLEFTYAERSINKIWATSSAFSSERGKGKPYYAYSPGSSMMSKQQAERLKTVRKAMTELRTKGHTSRKRDNQTPSLSDNHDAGSTSSFDLDVGGSDSTAFGAEDGLHVSLSITSTAATINGEGNTGRDSVVKGISGGDSVYPQVYSVRRFVNAPSALSSNHDLAEAKWYANRPTQALVWLATNAENNRIRQLAATGLQQQGYKYSSGQWIREA